MTEQERIEIKALSNCLIDMSAKVARIDERIIQLKNGDNGDIPEIKQHLITLNGSVKDNTIRSSSNKTSIKNLWVIIAFQFAFLGTIVGLLFKIIGLE